MSQSNFIAAFIFAAFFVYITLKDELPAYMKLLIPQSNGAGSTPIAGPGNVSASALPNLAPSSTTTAPFTSTGT